MQNILAGAAIGSIITLLIMVAWHRASVAYLQDQTHFWTDSFFEANDRLQRIKNQFKDGKSGTAKLAVKIARGEVA